MQIQFLEQEQDEYTDEIKRLVSNGVLHFKSLTHVCSLTEELEEAKKVAS